MTTKFGALESRDDLKRRIAEAAQYALLEQLCLSPQCGFEHGARQRHRGGGAAGQAEAGDGRGSGGGAEAGPRASLRTPSLPKGERLQARARPARLSVDGDSACALAPRLAKGERLQARARPARSASTDRRRDHSLDLAAVSVHQRRARLLDDAQSGESVARASSRSALLQRWTASRASCGRRHRPRRRARRCCGASRCNSWKSNTPASLLEQRRQRERQPGEPAPVGIAQHERVVVPALDGDHRQRRSARAGLVVDAQAVAEVVADDRLHVVGQVISSVVCDACPGATGRCCSSTGSRITQSVLACMCPCAHPSRSTGTQRRRSCCTPCSRSCARRSAAPGR